MKAIQICVLTIFVLSINFSVSASTPAINSTEYDSVKLNMKIYFPSKSVDKSFVITLTPRIGDYTFKEIWLMGEKGDDNRSLIINYKYGGTLTYWDAISYSSNIDGESLFIDIVVKEKNIQQEAITLKIENGIESIYRYLNRYTMCTIIAEVSCVKKK